MAKISQLKRSYHEHGPTPTATHRSFKSPVAPSEYSSPLKVSCRHHSHKIEQNMIWAEDAALRARGRSTLQRPTVDRLRCQGRTIYDVQYTPSKSRRRGREETPAPSPSQDRHRRRKASDTKTPRRRSLIDETLHQAENGKSLRKLSPVFELDIFKTEPEDDKSMVLLSWQDEEDCAYIETSSQSERSMPSLTWSESESPGDGSDSEEAFVGSAFETKSPLILGNFEIFSANEGYLINHLEPLGHMYDPWLSMENSSHNDIWSSNYDTMEEFFEMFVNTDDCEDSSSCSIAL